MFLTEMKRRLYTKFVLFSILGISIISIGLNFFITNDSKYITDNLQEEAVYEGNIKEDGLLKSLIRVRDEGSNEIRYRSVISIIDSLTNTYPGVLYSENKVKDYSDELAEDFYKAWENKFKALIQLKLSGADQNLALEKLNSIETPFDRYPGYYLYFNALDNIQIIFMIILLLVTFFAAGTYSNSFEDESMEIINATKGYRRSMLIRIFPPIIYGSIMTLIVVFITVGMMSSVVGLKALKSSFKMISLFSFGNLSIGESILIILFSEIIGIVALSVLMGYISLQTKETSKSIILGVSFSLIYMVGSRLVTSSTDIIQSLFNLIPIASSQMLKSIMSFSFKFGVWDPYIIIIGSLSVFIVSAIGLITSIVKN